jgi:hypothetical protein
MTNNTRLDEIVERNSRSRVVDIAFAAMVALMLTLSLVSLRASAARPLVAHALSADATPLASA